MSLLLSLKFWVGSLAVALAMLVPAAPADAAASSARPVRVIVPFPPGGGADIVARLVALRLGEALGRPMVVDNRSGAGGTIATDIAAKALPDGNTLLVSNISLAVNATLYPNLPYDTLKDLATVAMVCQQPNVLVVHPAVPAQSVRELLDLARAKPGVLNYGSGGFGTSTYLATELLKLTTKLQMVHVPYKGLGPAMTDLLAGQVQMIISTMAPALPQVKAGRLRALAVTSVSRSAFLSEIPSMREAGVPGYEFTTWYGLWAPSRMTRPMIDRLNAHMARITDAADVKEQLALQGMEPLAASPDEFASYLKKEVEKWGKIIKAAGAKPE